MAQLVSEEIQDIIYLIQVAGLDLTIQVSLIQTLLAEGLTDTVKKQIATYCMDALSKRDPEVVARVKEMLESGVSDGAED